MTCKLEGDVLDSLVFSSLFICFDDFDPDENQESAEAPAAEYIRWEVDAEIDSGRSHQDQRNQ